jgi:hypothetical protein
MSVRCYGSWSLGHSHRRFYQTTVLFLNPLSFLFLCSLGLTFFLSLGSWYVSSEVSVTLIHVDLNHKYEEVLSPYEDILPSY